MSDTGGCLRCGEADTRPTVFCTDCGSVHHGECFASKGCCAMCGALRFSARGRGGRDVQRIRVGSEDRLILDLTTAAETTTGMVIFVAAVLVIMSFVHGDVTAAAVGCIMLCLGRFAHHNTDCYYIADGPSQSLMYHQRILGRLRMHTVLSFDAIARVQAVAYCEWVGAGEDRPAKWSHSLALEIEDASGARHLLSNFITLESKDSNNSALLEAASELARLAGRPLEFAANRDNTRRKTAGLNAALGMFTATMVLAAISPPFVLLVKPIGAVSLLLGVISVAQNSSSASLPLKPSLDAVVEELSHPELTRIYELAAGQVALLDEK